jgi:hypothetical protein
MKRLLTGLALSVLAVSANAQHHGYYGNGIRHNHHHHGYYRSGNWVAPLVIGGVVGYALTRPDPVIVQQPVIVQNPPVIVQQETCSAWREIQSSDGTIYRERTCTK